MSTCCNFWISVPSEVTNVRISAISNSSILVQWDPPAHPNGILIYYDVIVFNILTNFNESVQISVSETQEMTVTAMGTLWSLHGAYPWVQSLRVVIQSHLLLTLYEYLRQQRLVEGEQLNP